jgi:hypothetical protein
VVVASSLALATCSPGTGGPAGFCGWIGTDVNGLGHIVAEDGTRWVGTWYHAFAEGVTDADESSRDAIASAVAADTDGFERLHREAPEQVRPALDRLFALLQDPTEAQTRATDVNVRQDVDLIDAQGCDFLRESS